MWRHLFVAGHSHWARLSAGPTAIRRHCGYPTKDFVAIRDASLWSWVIFVPVLGFVACLDADQRFVVQFYTCDSVRTPTMNLRSDAFGSCVYLNSWLSFYMTASLCIYCKGRMCRRQPERRTIFHLFSFSFCYCWCNLIQCTTFY